MEKLHTPEPWEAYVAVFGGQEYLSVAHKGIPESERQRAVTVLSPTNSMDEEDIANARRIVACVNACKDIPSEKLDGLATMARLGIELTDAINDPDGRFNRLEKEHYANEFALDKAGISGEDCGAKVSKGIELLTTQRDELLSALKDAKNRLEHLMPTEDPQEQNDDPFEAISVICSRASGAYDVINTAIMKASHA